MALIPRSPAPAPCPHLRATFGESLKMGSNQGRRPLREPGHRVRDVPIVRFLEFPQCPCVPVGVDPQKKSGPELAWHHAWQANPLCTVDVMHDCRVTALKVAVRGCVQAQAGHRRSASSISSNRAVACSKRPYSSSLQAPANRRSPLPRGPGSDNPGASRNGANAVRSRDEPRRTSSFSSASASSAGTFRIGMVFTALLPGGDDVPVKSMQSLAAVRRVCGRPGAETFPSRQTPEGPLWVRLRTTRRLRGSTGSWPRRFGKTAGRARPSPRFARSAGKGRERSAGPAGKPGVRVRLPAGSASRGGSWRRPWSGRRRRLGFGPVGVPAPAAIPARVPGLLEEARAPGPVPDRGLAPGPCGGRCGGVRSPAGRSRRPPRRRSRSRAARPPG